ncbi:hypothetical protein JY651_13785 [Pyxidicoccus parkwayensis]|uniref:YfhO family protein n=1 Tax=Pyxidicoccus parkwayensis TaxID=2813578 RepID=A0ABX7P655_9BACT|nr:DUF6311 domain-containing protein [Pyxidicoccus parkwaysis]QSQ25931.1 hypothetical protein JY651_13785 [Pyxidicoccus parkwaysis]
MRPALPARVRRLVDTTVAFITAHAGPLGAAGLGLLAFLALYGPAALNPTRLSWLIRDDFSQHLLGWLFFRNEPLRFPLGTIDGYLHPLGTTLGYMDAIPWVALLLRPFSSLLPVNFQYIGPWLCACLVLQGAAAAWVARRMSATVAQQWMVGGLLVLSPTLLARMGMAHEALSAHWAILLLVGLHLVPQRDARDAKQSLGIALALCVFAAGVHPVIAVIVLALAVALCARTALERTLPWQWTVLGAGASVGTVLALFYVFGYLGTVHTLRAEAFGSFSADLAAFANPLGYRDILWSRFLAALPRQGAQYEGFGYLGLGVLFALGASLILAARDAPRVARHWRRLVPLGLVALGFGFFALSSRITLLGELLADLTPLYAPVMPWVEPFRSSGRFVWPLYYVLALGSVLALIRLPRPAVAPSLLALALALQVFDVNLGQGQQSREGSTWNTQPSEALRAAAVGRKHLVLYPPQMHDGSGRGCRAGPMDFHRWAYRAYRLGLTFNSGYVARLDDSRAQPYCLGLDDDIRSGRLDPETIYLSIPERLHEFQAIRGTRCVQQEQLWMCVLEPTPPAPLRQASE